MSGFLRDTPRVRPLNRLLAERTQRIMIQRLLLSVYLSVSLGLWELVGQAVHSAR